MEELQSTEILDREILEDARKKARRILKSAEDTIKAQTTQWEKKAADSINELDKKYSEQCALAIEKVMSRLPIDKRRARIEKTESLLQNAVKSWYENLSRERILKLLTGELAKRLAIISEQLTANNGHLAKINGLNRKEAETILKNINFNCGIEEDSGARGIDCGGSFYPSITLYAGDIRIIASMQEIIDSLLQDKRAELVEALVGRAFIKEEI